MSAESRAFSTLARSHAIVFAVIFAGLVLLHIPYLRLPYFWDELGQFVPAALDIMREFAWVPHSTVPNVHPPAVMAYLALAWKLFGYSELVTRVAMLLMAAAGVYATFLLAIHLCRRVPGAPAFIVVGLLAVTPLFYTQSMMAQLDMPAMTFTVIALLLFVQGRLGWCVAACTVLVLAKETGAVAPAVFAAWLILVERRWKPALWFAIPFVALSVWLFVLWRATGHLLGDPGFAHYNVAYSLHPVRAIATLLRRLYFLFLADFRWIGTIAILFALRKTRFLLTREWTVITAFAILHILLVSLFGGAALERYLLPVFPMLYIAVATGWAAMSKLWRRTSAVALMAGLVLGLFWNPPFPFPLENNLAMVDFVQLQKATAEFLDERIPRAKVASAWPYTGALRMPDLGFTNVGYQVVETSDFHTRSVIEACLKDPPDVLIVYSRTWEPPNGFLSSRWVYEFLRRYYDYEPQITTWEVQEHLKMKPILRWEQRGQWIEVFAR
jgi:4-amino-4-deoxy-L-arabinose transferase-like glycosyltransferase